MKLMKKLLLLCLFALILTGAYCTYSGYMQYKEAITETPLAEKIAQVQAADNFVSYENIAPSLLQATIAIEDRRFYEHDGFDFIATARALFHNVIYREIVGGGSTITQQLAKNLYFGYHPSFVRKIAELFVVHDLENSYTKEEILTLYVNIINYGDHHIGIKEAAYGYFQTDPAHLTLDQSSLLAGLPQSPANYQLSDHLEQAEARQKQVLQAMTKENMITEQQMNDCLTEK